MDVIRLLPDSVANQIAAGEVIQRPASCLKELVENAIDAKAHSIHILVRDAGKTLIQVTDDGVGMSASDARMAFERHATSKIREASDLFHLQTMGFRGEALPSICAVSQVRLTTRRSEDEMGTLLEIAGSEVLRQEPCQCAVGTTMVVQNLFFNVPARRRFLKSDQTELRNLLTTFQHIVLVYPDISFTFASDDEIMYDLPVGTLKQRIEGVFGKSRNKLFTSNLLEIGQKTELVSLSGFVGKPSAAGKQAQQFFFVNGRYMRHPYFHKAVMQAYTGMIDSEHTPPYFIYFDVSPEQIDVNVHPTKTEIKFADEQSIFPILSATIRAALGKFNIVPSIDFMGGNITIPVADERTKMQAKAPELHISAGYNPFDTSQSLHGESGHRAVDSHWQSLHTESGHRAVDSHWQSLYETSLPTLQADYLPQEGAGIASVVEGIRGIDGKDLQPMYLSGGYIACQTDKGLLLVHARRAHVSVLYDQLSSQLRAGHGASQQLLFSERMVLTAEEEVSMQAIEDQLACVGFGLSKVENGVYNITAMPSVMGSRSAVDCLKGILASWMHAPTDILADMQHQIALGIARDSAISSAKPLTEVEMEDLLKSLFRLSAYRITPDGKTVCILLTGDELARMFHA